MSLFGTVPTKSEMEGWTMRKVTEALLILLVVFILGVVVTDRVKVEIDKMTRTYTIVVEEQGTFFSDMQPMVDGTGVGFIDARTGFFRVFNGYPYNIEARMGEQKPIQDHN